MTHTNSFSFLYSFSALSCKRCNDIISMYHPF
nr:MAG TPA: hypothetical protein [Caudoviricetes sp.]